MRVHVRTRFKVAQRRSNSDSDSSVAIHTLRLRSRNDATLLTRVNQATIPFCPATRIRLLDLDEAWRTRASANSQISCVRTWQLVSTFSHAYSQPARLITIRPTGTPLLQYTEFQRVSNSKNFRQSELLKTMLSRCFSKSSEWRVVTRTQCFPFGVLLIPSIRTSNSSNQSSSHFALIRRPQKPSAAKSLKSSRKIDQPKNLLDEVGSSESGRSRHGAGSPCRLVAGNTSDAD